MGEKIKNTIAQCTLQICTEYIEIERMLQSIPTKNSSLQQFLTQLNSTLEYCKTHFYQESTIQLAACKAQHDPVRLLNNIENSFHNLEQGFYTLYPEPQTEQQILHHFNIVQVYYVSLEAAIESIP